MTVIVFDRNMCVRLYYIEYLPIIFYKCSIYVHTSKSLVILYNVCTYVCARISRWSMYRTVFIAIIKMTLKSTMFKLQMSIEKNPLNWRRQIVLCTLKRKLTHTTNTRAHENISRLRISLLHSRDQLHNFSRNKKNK